MPKNTRKLSGLNVQLTVPNIEEQTSAAELQAANQELEIKIKINKELAEELRVANTELLYQNNEKEKRAAELLIANTELAFQNKEKESRAAELIIANKELEFQKEEKGKRADELLFANKELQIFTFISSHDLQEPLRKIQLFIALILGQESANLSHQGTEYLKRIQSFSLSMRGMIDSLLIYSNANLGDQNFETVLLDTLLEEVKYNLAELIDEKKAIIYGKGLGDMHVNLFQFRLLFYHLIENALKFSKEGVVPTIHVTTQISTGADFTTKKPALLVNYLSPDKKYILLRFNDNGMGFDQAYKDQIFDVFQRLNAKETHAGSGIGLPIVKKIVNNHNGIITATGEAGKGAEFSIYIPLQG